MTTKHDVIAAHQQYPQWTASEIAAHLGCLPEYVRATAQRNSLRLPKIRGASPIVRLSAPAVLALSDHAAAREISVSDLAKRIVETIARENMVDAVLDDGGGA